MKTESEAKLFLLQKAENSKCKMICCICQSGILILEIKTGLFSYEKIGKK